MSPVTEDEVEVEKIKKKTQHIVTKAIKAVWYCACAIPTALFWTWLANFPSRLDLYVSRTSLPHGMLTGIAWVAVNAIICLLGCLIAFVPVVLIIFLVWRLQDTIVTKAMNEDIRKFLELDETNLQQ